MNAGCFPSCKSATQNYLHCNSKLPQFSQTSYLGDTFSFPLSSRDNAQTQWKMEVQHPTCRHRGRTSVLYLVTQAGMRTPILLWCHVLCMPRSQPLCCFSGDLCLIKCWFLNYPKVVRESTRKASPSLSRCALSFSRLTFQKCQPNSHTQPLPSC